MKADSSPCPDDFSTLLYQEFWQTTENDIMDVMSAFYMGYLDIQRCNYAGVVLIRKNRANAVIGFGPISLLNVIYKIITKTLTQRLNPVLCEITDKSQYGFIPGRFILDGVAVGQELMLAWERQGKEDGALLNWTLLRSMIC